MVGCMNLMAGEESSKTFSLYIHWPYCQKICPYCNFNVYRARKDTMDTDLVEALIKEMEVWRCWSGRRRLASIHFGGGTPSLLPSSAVETVLNAADRYWGIREETEIALEANPSDCQAFPMLAKAGITRLSLGVQSLEDESLRLLGRSHNRVQALKSLDTALQCFPRVSIDLIYARPGQKQSSWEKELGFVFTTGIEHVSLYQLSVENGTALEKQVQRQHIIPQGDDQAALFYEQTQILCEEAGFFSYEISNHARHLEAYSKHNFCYWTNGDWAGIGPGASGRLTREGNRFAYQTFSDPKHYIMAVRQGKTGICEKVCLTEKEWANEVLLMGLRLTKRGVSLSEVERIANRSLDKAVLLSLLQAGWLQLQDAMGQKVPNALLYKGTFCSESGDSFYLCVTEKGRLVLDRLVTDLAYDTRVEEVLCCN